MESYISDKQRILSTIGFMLIYILRILILQNQRLRVP